MPLKYVEFKGRTILMMDYSSQSGAQGIATLDEEVNEIRKWTQKGLVLSDYRGAKASPAFRAHAKKLAKEFDAKTHKSACGPFRRPNGPFGGIQRRQQREASSL